MARAFEASSEEDYTPSAVTANANTQKMYAYKHYEEPTGADWHPSSKERPILVHPTLGSHAVTVNYATYDSANSGAASHFIDYFVAYELLKRGWIVFSPDLTTAGFGGLTGGGAAAKAGTARYQSADANHAAYNKDICYCLQHIHNTAATRGGDVTRIHGIGISSTFQALLWGGARDYVSGELGAAGTVDLGFKHPITGSIVGITPQAYYPSIVGTAPIAGFSALPGDEDTAASTLSQLNADLLEYFSPITIYERGSVRPPLLLMAQADSGVVTDPEGYGVFPPSFIETDVHGISQVEIFKRRFPGEDITAWAIAAGELIDDPAFGSSKLDDRFPGGAADELNTPAVRATRDWLIDQDVKRLGRYHRLGHTYRMRLDTTEYACVSPNSKYKSGARISMYGTADSVANVIVTDDSTVEPSDTDTGERYILPDAVTPNGNEPMVTLDIKGSGAIWMKASAANYTFTVEY